MNEVVQACGRFARSSGYPVAPPNCEEDLKRFAVEVRAEISRVAASKSGADLRPALDIAEACEADLGIGRWASVTDRAEVALRLATRATGQQS